MGLPGDQIANLHLPLPTDLNDFFPGVIGGTFPGMDGGETHIPPLGEHRVRNACLEEQPCPALPDFIVPVPEPSTLLLLGSGLAGVAAFGRKKLAKKV